jgi:uncharacterized membrane protein YqiK
MRTTAIALFIVTIGSFGVASAEPAKKTTTTENKVDQRPAKQKKEQAEKKGALKERVDPAKDLAAQKANVKQLEHNAEVEKKNGNHVAAWAAESDAKHAEKLEKKDEKLIQKGEKKKDVDGQSTRKK